jgi:hypothetical protein
MTTTIVWLNGSTVIAREGFEGFVEAKAHALAELGRMQRTYAATAVRIEENGAALFLKSAAP